VIEYDGACGEGQPGIATLLICPSVSGNNAEEESINGHQVGCIPDGKLAGINEKRFHHSSK
jgi:hypothetical protein